MPLNPRAKKWHRASRFAPLSLLSCLYRLVSPLLHPPSCTPQSCMVARRLGLHVRTVGSKEKLGRVLYRTDNHHSRGGYLRHRPSSAQHQPADPLARGWRSRCAASSTKHRKSEEKSRVHDFIFNPNERTSIEHLFSDWLA